MLWKLLTRLYVLKICQDLFRESTKGQRAALARSIVTIVCTAFKPPGRFLQLHPAQDRWSDMSEQEARFVTMLALLRAIHGCCVKDNAADLLGVKGTIATQNNIAGKRKLDDTMKASPTSVSNVQN